MRFPTSSLSATDGGLPPHDREQMRRFLAIARREAPGLRILPWVGGLRVGYRRQREGTIALADLVQRQRIVAECRGLIDEGFDGVHLNVEPVPDSNVDFLALLRALRTAVDPGILSVSAIRPGPVALPFAPNFFWTPAYYGRVASVADQIVVMAYDTALPTAPAYRRYLAWSAETVSEALDVSASECAGSHGRSHVRRHGDHAPRGGRNPGERPGGHRRGPPRPVGRHLRGRGALRRVDHIRRGLADLRTGLAWAPQPVAICGTPRIDSDLAAMRLLI